jgi:hypothetical protein
MHTKHKKNVYAIACLILLSFACSFIPVPGANPTPTSLSANQTAEPLPTAPVPSAPTIAIPIFEPTITKAATSIAAATLVDATASLPPTKKAKTPSANQTTDPNLVCPNAQPTRLKLNGFGFLTYDPPIPNRVRIGPGLNFDAKGLVKPGQVMQFISGPICAGESVWWKVVVRNTELTGWVAEADSQQYWLEPCPAEGHCPPLAP